MSGSRAFTTPSSNVPGAMTLVGQAPIQRPQRMQLSQKPSMSCPPGGRGHPPPPKGPYRSRPKAASTPNATAPSITLRRLTAFGALPSNSIGASQAPVLDSTVLPLLFIATPTEALLQVVHEDRLISEKRGRHLQYPLIEASRDHGRRPISEIVEPGGDMLLEERSLL